MNANASALDPIIELIPARPAVSRNVEGTLDVLIRVSAPTVDRTDMKRLPLNVGVVLDRSGSMAAANKLNFAKQAAAHLVRSLADSDTVSIVIFDEEVEALVPATRVGAAHDAILRRIASIVDRGSTDLHGGWLEGGTQVAGVMREGALNRVLLLSDGIANIGVVHPQVICEHVRGLMQRGVSTTTLGVGLDYNEDLLQAMAEAGDGNYYFIENPSQLPSLFEAELAGLSTTLGTKVSLEVAGRGDAEVLDVLNDFPRAASGRHMLPNLVENRPVEIIARLRLPAVDEAEMRVCRVRRAWDDRETRMRHKVLVKFALPTASEQEVVEMAEDARVRERATLLAIARDKRRAGQDLARGDHAAARARFARSMQLCQTLPSTPRTQEELEDLRQLTQTIDDGDYVRTSKRTKSSAYRTSTSRLTH